MSQWVARHRFATASALAIAAVLILTVWATARLRRAEDPLQGALARLDQSLGEYRPIEARLTGASYRPMVSATRAAAPNAEVPLDVRESATAVERAALALAPAIKAHAMAKMHLVSGQPDRAVDELAPFVGGSHDARFLTDTSAAYFTRARDGDRAHALDAAARAVDIDPYLVEAWFNLALASEALGQYSLASDAWSHVQQLDATGWAREAAAKRANAPKRQSWGAKDEGEFRAAVEQGDDDAAAGVAERSLADARAFFEQSILSAVAERWDGGDRVALTAAVARAEAAARALGRLNADRWPMDVAFSLREMVNRGDAAAGRATCIPALLDAVKLRSADQWSEADDRLAHTRPCGVAVPDALALHTQFVRLRNAASSTQPRDNLPGQLAEFSRRAGAHEYFGLQGRALRTEAVVLTRWANYVEALDRCAAAEAAARRAMDLDTEVTSVTQLAEVYDYLGAQEKGWRERSRALARLYSIRSAQRRFNVYHDAILASVNASLDSAALRLLDGALSDMRGEPDFTLVLLADRAALLSHLGRSDEANADVGTALKLLPQAGKSAEFEGFRRSVLKSQAMVSLHDDPATAVKALTALIETANAKSVTFEAAELLFLRAAAYASQSNLDRADADFRSGFDLVERRQLNLPDHLQPAAFDRIWNATAAAIRLHAVTRRDPMTALVFAERARAASLTSHVRDSRPFEGSEAFRRKLPPNVAVVFLSVLDDAVLSWGIASAPESVSFHRAPIAYAEVADLAKRFRDALQSESRESFAPLARRLYDIVLAPHAAVMSGTSTLVIVPDGPLLAAPFAALVGPNGRLLIEDRAVIVAPNLRLLRTLASRGVDRRGPPSAVAFGNPTLGRELPWPLRPLAGAENEARIVATTYHGTALVGAAATKTAFLAALRRYDVVHFAGHAVVNTARAGSSSLILAPSAGDAGVLSPGEIGATRIAPGALVVLAACDTAEGSVFRGEGLMGLVRPFIAAGAAHVVANLWPLDDEATVEFSAAFHHHVRGGVAPGRALQMVQEDFASRKRPAWVWAGWVIIGGYN